MKRDEAIVIEQKNSGIQNRQLHTKLFSLNPAIVPLIQPDFFPNDNNIIAYNSPFVNRKIIKIFAESVSPNLTQTDSRAPSGIRTQSSTFVRGEFYPVELMGRKYIV